MINCVDMEKVEKKKKKTEKKKKKKGLEDKEWAEENKSDGKTKNKKPSLQVGGLETENQVKII